LHDNPRLDVRMVATERQPHVVVVDSQLQTPPHAAVFDTARQVLIYTLRNDTGSIAALQAHGATVITQPAHATLPRSHIDLPAMLQDLAQREINELHVEAGHTLNGALLQAGWVDELLVYLAPTLLGTGAGMIRTSALTALTQGTPLRFISSTTVGTDLRILARVVGQDDF